MAETKGKEEKARKLLQENKVDYLAEASNEVVHFFEVKGKYTVRYDTQKGEHVCTCIEGTIHIDKEHRKCYHVLAVETLLEHIQVNENAEEN